MRFPVIRGVFCAHFLAMFTAMVSIDIGLGHDAPDVGATEGDQVGDLGYFAFRKGSLDASSKVEIFLDPSSATCVYAWILLEDIVHEYHDQVDFVIRVLPLPYHLYSFEIAKAVQVVREYSDRREKALEYSGREKGAVETFVERACFDNLAFVEASSAPESILPFDVADEILAYWAEESGSLSSEEFRAMSEGEYDRRARLEFERACNFRVSRTPSVLVDESILLLPGDGFEHPIKVLRSFLDASVVTRNSKITDNASILWLHEDQSAWSLSDGFYDVETKISPSSESRSRNLETSPASGD